MDEVVARSLVGRQLSLAVLATFATVALILAVVGIYGVVGHVVQQRTREFGVRLALGAPRGGILGQVLGYGVRLALTGTVVGVACALAVSGLLRSQLHHISAADPVTFAVVAAGLLAVTLLACLVPARRATAVDSLTALRSE